MHWAWFKIKWKHLSIDPLPRCALLVSLLPQRPSSDSAGRALRARSQYYSECAVTDTHTDAHSDARTHRRERFYTLDRWRRREQTTLFYAPSIYFIMFSQLFLVKESSLSWSARICDLWPQPYGPLRDFWHKWYSIGSSCANQKSMINLLEVGLSKYRQIDLSHVCIELIWPGKLGKHSKIMKIIHLLETNRLSRIYIYCYMTENGLFIINNTHVCFHSFWSLPEGKFGN